MKVFGDVDRDSKGKIRSEYPSWYFDPQREELGHEISEMENALDNDAIPTEAKARFKASLRQKKDRFQRIEADVPKFKGDDKDKIVKLRKEIEGQLKEAHPRRSEKDKGFTDAHEEARRMSEPVMKISNQAQAEFAEACGIKITDGKITRNAMDKMYKITGKMLKISGEDESTDIESIRRP